VPFLTQHSHLPAAPNSLVHFVSPSLRSQYYKLKKQSRRNNWVCYAADSAPNRFMGSWKVIAWAHPPTQLTLNPGPYHPVGKPFGLSPSVLLLNVHHYKSKYTSYRWRSYRIHCLSPSQSDSQRRPIYVLMGWGSSEFPEPSEVSKCVLVMFTTRYPGQI